MYRALIGRISTSSFTARNVNTTNSGLGPAPLPIAMNRCYGRCPAQPSAGGETPPQSRRWSRHVFGTWPNCRHPSQMLKRCDDPSKALLAFVYTSVKLCRRFKMKSPRPLRLRAKFLSYIKAICLSLVDAQRCRLVPVPRLALRGDFSFYFMAVWTLWTSAVATASHIPRHRGLNPGHKAQLSPGFR